MKRSQFPITIALLLWAEIGFGQVNTEIIRRAGDTTGFGGEVSFAMSFASGNSDFLTLNPGFRLDLATDKEHAFAVFSYEFGEASKEVFQKRGFGHVRYIHRLTPRISPEAFAQKEFDDFIELNDRTLAGAGLRLRLFENESMEWHIGVGGMFEAETYQNNLEPDRDLVRSTNYLSLSWQRQKLFKLRVTAYYQMAVSRTSDFRFLLDSRLKFKMAEWLAFETTLNLRFDNEPLPGIAKHDLRLSNGVTVSF